MSESQHRLRNQCCNEPGQEATPKLLYYEIVTLLHNTTQHTHTHTPCHITNYAHATRNTTGTTARNLMYNVKRKIIAVRHNCGYLLLNEMVLRGNYHTNNARNVSKPQARHFLRITTVTQRKSGNSERIAFKSFSSCSGFEIPIQSFSSHFWRLHNNIYTWFYLMCSGKLVEISK